MKLLSLSLIFITIIVLYAQETPTNLPQKSPAEVTSSVLARLNPSEKEMLKKTLAMFNASTGLQSLTLVNGSLLASVCKDVMEARGASATVADVQKMIEVHHSEEKK